MDTSGIHAELYKLLHQSLKMVEKLTAVAPREKKSSLFFVGAQKEAQKGIL